MDRSLSRTNLGNGVKKRRSPCSSYNQEDQCKTLYIERKNGSIRRELLNAYLFYSLNEVREMCEEWRVDYNHERPHKALGYRSPIMYLKQWQEKNQCCSDRALSTPASETLIQIEAQPVVDKAAAEENIINLKTLLLN